MKSKVIKRAAAALTAMVMAVSMMAVSVSAKSNSGENSYLSVTGVTTHSSTADGIIYGLASSTVKNKTSIERYMAAQVNIYNDNDVMVAQTYKFGNVAYGKTLWSNQAKELEDNCEYAIASGVLYNSYGTTMGGEYSHKKVWVTF